MERWSGRVALVTGASSGIGAALCKRLVEEGLVVVGTARRVEQIERLAEDLKGKRGKLYGIKCDLTKDADVENLFSEIKKKYGGVDVCINNAGMSLEYSLFDGNPETWRKMLDVNVVALCHCSKLALKSMQEKGIDDGHIIHIGSISGHIINPNYPPLHFYCATKHAVICILEGMRRELRLLKSKIRVSAISPGLVETPFLAALLGEEKANKVLGDMLHLNSEDIANSVCHILEVPPHVQVHEIIIKPVGEEA